MGYSPNSWAFCMQYTKKFIHILFFRIEYDAYRTDLELLAQAPRSEATVQRLEEAQQAFDAHKENFEKLRSDLTVKLKFLDENRVSMCKWFINSFPPLTKNVNGRCLNVLNMQTCAKNFFSTSNY